MGTQSKGVRLRLIILVALLVVLCSEAVAAEEEASPDALLAARLCHGRAPCSMVKKVIPDIALAKSDGWRLRFVVLRKDPAGWGELPRWDDKNGRFLPCVPYEAWAVKLSGRTIESIQLVAELCNDGYGARGIGQDFFRLEGSTVEHKQSGGSNWGWENSFRFDLDERQFRSTTSRGWFSGGRQEELITESFLDLRGETIWYADHCDWMPNPRSPEPAPPKSQWYAYSHIPQPILPKQFLSDRWDQVALGDCALSVDSKGVSGHIVHGKPGRVDDAWFRVVAESDREIAVEFGDDVWTLNADEERNADHFEIWTGQRSAYDSTCNSPEPPLRQWFVSIADGSIHQTYGPKGQAPMVRVLSADTTRRRLRLVFAKRPESFTLIYSDSDDGEGQKRLIGTSRLRFAKVRTLGQISTPIKASLGRCVESGDELSFRASKQPISARTPVFKSPD